MEWLANRVLRTLLPGVLLPLLLFAGGCAGGADDPAIAAAADAEVARRPGDYTNGEARAWAVSRNGVTHALLWGTIHVGYSGATVLPRAMRERFYEAADLTVETVIDRLPREELQRLVRLYRTANLAADPAALARLDAPTRLAIAEAVPAGTQQYSLRGLAYVVGARVTAYDPTALPQVGMVDSNLIGFARSQSRTVLGLERPQTPDPTLREPNGPDAEAMLRQALRRRGTARAMGDWALAAYSRGEVARAVASLVAWQAEPADLARSDRARAALFTRRNLAWLPRLETTLGRPGLHFVAVGAGHLLGTDGLVTLLRGAGWTVTPCVGDVCP